MTTKREHKKKINVPFIHRIQESLINFLLDKLDMLKNLLRYTPLLITSAVANFGTLTLSVLISSGIAVLYISSVLLLNFLTCLGPSPWIKKVMSVLGMSDDLPPARESAGKPNQHAVFMTWSNMFLMSKSLEEPSFQRT